LQAKSVGPALLKSIVKMHYNWKYAFLRPSVEEVVARYKVHHQKTHAAAPTGLAAAIAASTAAANAAAAATAAS
jgi:hypothetical protein